ncbi:hypothetical protein ACFYUV_10115 [Nonomuraea sp. NPDC003560]|uniref:hypothetical protein n=1 Tax=Nonomuraea sp. NPDC003560 TaxID=3364341 RepID=UPI0036A593EF
MPNASFPVAGLIGERWQELLAENGPLGAPVSVEMDLNDGQRGRRQSFAHGVIAWMPDQEMVLTVFRLGGEMVFDWSVTRESQLHYDYFRIDVLYRRDGSQPFTGAGHANLELSGFKLPELPGVRRGTYFVRLHDFGEYAFKVKGVDAPGLFGGESSVQGWTPLIRFTIDPAAVPAEAAVPDDPLIAERWHVFGAGDGVFGAPVGSSVAADGGGRSQTFERGVIATFPQYGPRATLAGYRDARAVHVYWGYTDVAAPLGTFDNTVEAFNLDVGQGAEHSQTINSNEIEWLKWAQNGYSSGYARFYPVRNAGVPWDTESSRNYLIKVTDFAGQQFAAKLKFWHQPISPHLDRPALDGSPEHAAASHRDRINAVAEHYIRTQPFDLRNMPSDGEDVTFQLIAHLHMMRQQSDYRSEGQPRSSVQVAVALRQMNPKSPMGTDGEYDMTIKGLMTIMLRYRQQLTEPLITWMMSKLVPLELHGGHDEDIESYTAVPVIGVGPETENHVLMIESSRFLANQIYFELTQDDQYDNLKNGLADWLMNMLQVWAKYDLLEFNSRPYNRPTVHSLLNLYEFSTDPPLRTAARHVLDYLAVKFAVSSCRHRHAGPFRRRREHVNAATGELNSLMWKDGHPLTGFSLAYFGPIAPDGTPSMWFDDNWLPEALLFAAGSYRPPAAAYILSLTEQAAYQHTFYHGTRPIPPHGEQPDGGVEIYYKSPSFLLTAGGTFLNSGSGSDNVVMSRTGTNGCAVPQATTLLPRHADPFFADLIRFDPYTERGVNTCVHLGFACGGNLRLPGFPAGQRGWFFIDHGDLGYYVAAYRTPPGGAQLVEPLDSLGFIYVLELRTPGDPDAPAPMTFAEFKEQTLDRNQLPDPLDYATDYLFNAADGHSFLFRTWAEGEKYRPRILRMDGQLLPESFGTTHLVEGPYLNAPNGHDGYLEIRHPQCNTPLVLDFRNHLVPHRADNSAACPQWHHAVIDATYQRAKAFFGAGKYLDARAATLQGLDEFRRARLDNPGLGDDQLRDLAGQWHSTARSAHPDNVPVQLAAAHNAWDIYQFLASEEEDELVILASQIVDLMGYLAFGSPISADASDAAGLARDLYARSPGDHSVDIAGVWTNEAQVHHLTSFVVAAWPGDAVEQLHQREAAAEALSILDPIVRSLPSSEVSEEDLGRIAGMLNMLIGFASFGSADSAPSDHAGELVHIVYANLHDRDHRVDLARAYTALAMRHHETGYWFGHWAGNPDLGNAELAKQREVAQRAAAIAEPMAEALPDPDLGSDDLLGLAGLLRKLIGLLTHGSSNIEPGVRAAELARRAYKYLEGDHRIDVAQVWTDLAMRHHETSFVAGCPDPEAERHHQREAAAEATRLLLAIGDQLQTYPQLDRRDAADMLDKLTGLLVFGAPPPPDPETISMQNLAESAGQLRDRIRSTL